MQRAPLSYLLSGLLMGAVAFTSASASAYSPPNESPPDHPWVGGHVGLALPLVTFTTAGTDAVQGIGADYAQLGLAPGITVHLDGRWAVDFEFVAYSDFKNDITNIVIDPGLLYDFDVITLGFRVAINVTMPSNFGFIPIIVKGWDIGRANVFVELDLPMFITSGEFALTIQPQLGVSF